MSVVWNECVLIYSGGEFTDSYDPVLMKKSFKNYIKIVGKSPKCNIWYDMRQPKCFGNDRNWKNSRKGNVLSAFISGRNDFLSRKQFWGLNYVKRKFAKEFGRDCISDTEITYKDMPELIKFKGSKILLVGAGPSTMQVDWNFEDYDYVWSTNHFYLCPKLCDVGVSLVTLSTDVDFSLKNDKFHNYMEEHNTLMVFEEGGDCRKKDLNIKKINKQYEGRCLYINTRYRGKIGAIPRLLCFAIALGAKEISFVGMDGLREIDKVGKFANHAFVEDKKYCGTLDYDVYRRQYVMLWDYILNELEADRYVKLQNLGEGTLSNQTTDISRQRFPLGERFEFIAEPNGVGELEQKEKEDE